MPTAAQQIINPEQGFDGLSQVTVEGDANLVAANIVKDVSIFGVEGAYRSDVIKSEYGILSARSRLNATDTIVFAKYPEFIEVGDVPGLVAIALPSTGYWSTTFSDGSRGRTVTTNVASGESKGAYIDTFPPIQPVGQGFSLFQSGSIAPGYSLSGGSIVNSEILAHPAFWFNEPVPNGYSDVQIIGSLKGVGNTVPRIYLLNTPVISLSQAPNPVVTAAWLQRGTGTFILQISLKNTSGASLFRENGIYVFGVFAGNPAGITQILFY